MEVLVGLHVSTACKHYTHTHTHIHTHTHTHTSTHTHTHTYLWGRGMILFIVETHNTRKMIIIMRGEPSLVVSGVATTLLPN